MYMYIIKIFKCSVFYFFSQGRELLMRMLEVFVLKFKTIAKVQLPQILQKWCVYYFRLPLKITELYTCITCKTLRSNVQMFDGLVIQTNYQFMIEYMSVIMKNFQALQ